MGGGETGESTPMGRSLPAAAQALGVTLVLAEHAPQQFTEAFTLINRARVQALLVSSSPAAFADCQGRTRLS